MFNPLRSRNAVRQYGNHPGGKGAVRTISAIALLALLGASASCSRPDDDGGNGGGGGTDPGGCVQLSALHVHSQGSSPGTGCGRPDTDDPSPSPSAREQFADSFEPGRSESIPAQNVLSERLVGRWQGGTGDNYFLTLTADGTYTWENRFFGPGPFDYGVVSDTGTTLTLHSKAGGKDLTFPYSLSVSPELFGFTFTTLQLGTSTYVR